MLEARAELDALEDLRALPAVALRARRFAPFFAAAPSLLQPGSDVDAFVGGLVTALLPDSAYLAALARGAAAGGGPLASSTGGTGGGSTGAVPSLL